MSKWFIYNKKENYDKLNKYSSLTSLQKLILANRDLTRENELEPFVDPDVNNMHDPFLMKDMSLAVDFIFESILAAKRICIIGDYDADGVSATTILVKGISLFHQDIGYIIPDRVEDGYGLSKALVDQAYQMGVDLIITCDNGIAAHEAIDYAKDKGLDVIVTDHHEVVKVEGKENLPRAVAVINPHQKDCNYPFKGICGAVVAYKLIDALYMRYGYDLGINKAYVHDLLQFAAIGTVSDVMDLVDENRLIVIEGLKLLNNTSNLGMQILLEYLNWHKEITVYTLGFIIGPTINATGRLFSAKLAVELFLSSDIKTLHAYASELVSLNSERKEMTRQSELEAIEKVLEEEKQDDDIIILYMPNTHESICGLVAGRVKERFNRPTIVFTDAASQENDLLKASGRSIENYDMHANLSLLRDYYESFGGHKMACGLSIKKEKLPAFKNELLSQSKLGPKDFIKTINVDAHLSLRTINFNLIEQIQALEPYGKGFESPKFASKNVIINNIAILGKNRNLVKLNLSQNQSSQEAISFDPQGLLKVLEDKFQYQDIENKLHLLIGKDIDILYRLNVNEFNGNKTIQLILEEIR